MGLAGVQSRDLVFASSVLDFASLQSKVAVAIIARCS